MKLSSDIVLFAVLPGIVLLGNKYLKVLESIVEVLNKYKDYITTPDEDGWRWYGTADKPYQYPSVTTIQDQAIPHPQGLLDWYIDSTRKKVEDNLKKTGDFGTYLHLIFDDLIWGREPEKVTKTAAPHVSAFKGWLLKHQVKPIATEFVLVNELYGYAGRVDALAEVDGRVEILDWKTGNHYKDGWSSQVGAYHLTLLELLGLKNEEVGVRVLQIARTGATLKEFKFQHLEFIQDSFLLALERFKRQPNFSKLKDLGWPYLHQKIFERKPIEQLKKEKAL